MDTADDSSGRGASTADTPSRFGAEPFRPVFVDLVATGALDIFPPARSGAPALAPMPPVPSASPLELFPQDELELFPQDEIAREEPRQSRRPAARLASLAAVLALVAAVLIGGFARWPFPPMEPGSPQAPVSTRLDASSPAPGSNTSVVKEDAGPSDAAVVEVPAVSIDDQPPVLITEPADRAQPAGDSTQTARNEPLPSAPIELAPVAATPLPAPDAVIPSAPPVVSVPSSAVAAATEAVVIPLPAPAAPITPAVDDEAGVRAALGRYRDAYQQLDAAAAEQVWPSVDERALSRAFANLASQSITFDDCRTIVNSSTASASCRGETTFVGRIGSRNAQTQSREWTFRLRKGGTAWEVESVRVR